MATTMTFTSESKSSDTPPTLSPAMVVQLKQMRKRKRNLKIIPKQPSVSVSTEPVPSAEDQTKSRMSEPNPQAK